jgi:outer membrane protein TolC
MFSGSFAPQSLDSPQVEPGYMLEGSQKLPWPGKRRLRGRAADAEANAAWHESADTRLVIIEAAQTAFYDYYLAWRLLELNGQNTRLARESHDAAQARYASNLLAQQDVLSAQLELLDLERRRLELRRMESVAVARINTLLSRPPELPLPPPAALHDPPELPPPELLRQTAFERRADLAMLAARLRAEEAQLALAWKEFFPDVEVWYRYDAYWQPEESDLRSQLGLNVNMPLNQKRRFAGVREASFRLRQRRAELDDRANDVMNDVQAAAARVAESQRAIALYQRQSLPLAELAAETARASYIAGSGDFLRLLESQRRRLTIEEQHAQAVAECYRRLAELERAVGGPIPWLAQPEEVPLAP